MKFPARIFRQEDHAVEQPKERTGSQLRVLAVAVVGLEIVHNPDKLGFVTELVEKHARESLQRHLPACSKQFQRPMKDHDVVATASQEVPLEGDLVETRIVNMT